MEENHIASYIAIDLQSLLLMMGPLPVSYYSSGPESYTAASVTEKTLMPEAETIVLQSKTLLLLPLHTLLSA